MFDVASLQALSRLSNTFGPPEDPFGSMGLLPMNQPSPQPQFDIQSRMQELYQPRMDMQNRFNSMLDAFPQPSNPSMLRKIGAALYGMSQPNSFEAATQFANAPYFNELGRYKQQIGPLQQAADNERLMNAQERQFANQVVTQEQRDRQLGETENKNRNTFELAKQKEERLKRLTDITEFKAKNPHIQWRVVNGTLYALDPATGKPEDTGITGMTDFEKMQFTAQAAMDRVVEQQKGATERTGMTVEGANQRNERTTQGAMDRTQYNVLNRPLRTGSNATTSPAGQARDKVNKATQFIRMNPELGQYVTINGLNVSVAPASTGGWFSKGPTPEQRQQILQAIGDTNGTTNTIRNTPSTASPSSASVTSGRVSVIGPNGERGTIPASQLQQAIAQGYKQVK